MGYAYLDKYGILHVVSTTDTAEQYSQGNVVGTYILNRGGYPLVEYKGELVEATVYSSDNVVVGKNDTKVNIEDYKELHDLYKQLV